MTEKEQFVKNVNDSENIISQIFLKEGEIIAEVAKEQRYRKNTGGETLGGRAIFFTFYFMFTFFLGGMFFVFSIKENFLIALVSAVYICFAFRFYFIKPFAMNKKIKETRKELEELKQSQQLEWLPYQYRTAIALDKIQECVKYDRVDNLRQVLDILDNMEYNVIL